ncbi:MAG TPA: inorganic diphosphatase [Chloroflexota bacterium]|nr:inorganic diphosphatase [Chloroflexota bacterium]
MDEQLLEVFVEIPRGSQNKYEYDPVRGAMRLDRVLYSSVHYPADYGYIEDTLADDGDHLDALVLADQPTFPGCLVRGRPVAVLHMEDYNGLDYKILCACADDPRQDDVRDLDSVPKHVLPEIENFFQIYKTLEPGKETTLRGWGDREEALRIIRSAQEAWTERRSPSP